MSNETIGYLICGIVVLGLAGLWVYVALVTAFAHGTWLAVLAFIVALFGLGL